jgi:hypothetical protein
LDLRKKNNRRVANNERLATLQAQVDEKKARIEREKAEERAAAAQALAMAVSEPAIVEPGECWGLVDPEGW